MKIFAALVVALVVLDPTSTTTMMAAAQSAWPCPGADRDTFGDVPLSERPNLEKILHNGYNFGLKPVTLPSTTFPGNPVEVHNGFVERPFRRFNGSSYLCHPWYQQDGIYCGSGGPVTMLDYESSIQGSLVEEQAMLEIASGNYGPSWFPKSPLLPNYTEWARQVQSFLQSEPGGDLRVPYLIRRSGGVSCSLNKHCFDPVEEFVSDLIALPINMTTEAEKALYQDFLDKWGYGGVKSFHLGIAEREVGIRTDGEPSVLYMGRAGGLADLNSTGWYYTDEDCQDPAPVMIGYEPWDSHLDDLFRPDSPFTTDEVPEVPNLFEIQDNFFELYRVYRDYPRDCEYLDWDYCSWYFEETNETETNETMEIDNNITNRTLASLKSTPTSPLTIVAQVEDPITSASEILPEVIRYWQASTLIAVGAMLL